MVSTPVETASYVSSDAKEIYCDEVDDALDGLQPQVSALDEGTRI